MGKLTENNEEDIMNNYHRAIISPPGHVFLHVAKTGLRPRTHRPNALSGSSSNCPLNVLLTGTSPSSIVGQ